MHSVPDPQEDDLSSDQVSWIYNLIDRVDYTLRNNLLSFPESPIMDEFSHARNRFRLVKEITRVDEIRSALARKLDSDFDQIQGQRNSFSVSFSTQDVTDIQQLCGLAIDVLQMDRADLVAFLSEEKPSKLPNYLAKQRERLDDLRGVYSRVTYAMVAGSGLLELPNTTECCKTICNSDPSE